MPEFVFDGVTEEDYKSAGSTKVQFPAGSKKGDILMLDIAIGFLDWKTAGQSMELPVEVTEDGENKGKEDSFYFGVKKESIWKVKDIYKNITGNDMPMKKGADGQNHPSIRSEDLLGKPAVGVWVMAEGRKGGDPKGEITVYPKLQDIKPAGTVKSVAEDLGI